MLTIYLSNKEEVQSKCTIDEVIGELRLQSFTCITAQLYLGEQITITGFKYETED